MSDHSEVTGILVFILVVAVIGGGAYGVSALLGRSSGSGIKTTTPQAAESSPESSADESAPESSSDESQGESQPSQSQPSQSASEGQGEAAEPSLGDTIYEHGVYFQLVDEQVTAKIETNLRSLPSTESDDYIVATIYNGDWIRRTGIGHNGWSRVEYDGQVLYAVTSYLSTDGSSSSTPTYQEVSESVTAKEETNLRTSPESADDSNVVGTLTKGTYLTRTGIGSNGWSRLDYNGTEVYAVTSLLTTERAQPAQESAEQSQPAQESAEQAQPAQ